MTNKVSQVFVLDTDHLSLYGRNHPKIVARLQEAQSPLNTTVISLWEQLRGRLAQVAQARDDASKSIAYSWLTETVTLLSEFQILQYDLKAQETYQTLKHLRIGTQDLRIASIVLANDATLLTRNLQDFEKIPELSIQDWST
jgi:tRNA(fMet)-specific endonuclease VapC